MPPSVRYSSSTAARPPRGCSNPHLRILDLASQLNSCNPRHYVRPDHCKWAVVFRALTTASRPCLLGHMQPSLSPGGGFEGANEGEMGGLTDKSHRHVRNHAGGQNGSSHRTLNAAGLLGGSSTAEPAVTGIGTTEEAPPQTAAAPSTCTIQPSVLDKMEPAELTSDAGATKQVLEAGSSKQGSHSKTSLGLGSADGQTKEEAN